MENQTLEQRFMQAMTARENGDLDSAAEMMLGILKIEPRLAEPHLELAHIYLHVEQLEDAQTHIDEAIIYLESGGQWTDDLEPDEILSLAYSTKGEIYRALAGQDEIVFGNEEEFTRLLKESKSAFKKASLINPNNEHAAYWSRSMHWSSTLTEKIEELDNDDSVIENTDIKNTDNKDENN